MNSANKELIRTRFSRSIPTYNNNAIAQKIIARTIISSIKESVGNQFYKVFEIGCGTGILTLELYKNIEIKEIILNDIVEECRRTVKIKGSNVLKYEFICGDAEVIDFPTGQDLIIASSVVQWFNNPCLFLEKAYKSLNNEGILAFNSYMPNNFPEIKEITSYTLKYYKTIDYFEYIKEIGFHIVEIKEEEIILNFENPIDVLKHIKATGVNAIKEKHFFRKHFEEFVKEYSEKFKTEDGKVTLTYKPIYFILKK